MTGTGSLELSRQKCLSYKSHPSHENQDDKPRRPYQDRICQRKSGTQRRKFVITRSQQAPKTCLVNRCCFPPLVVQKPCFCFWNIWARFLSQVKQSPPQEPKWSDSEMSRHRNSITQHSRAVVAVECSVLFYECSKRWYRTLTSSFLMLFCPICCFHVLLLSSLVVLSSHSVKAWYQVMWHNN